MTLADILIWVLRAFGALYLVGGIFLIRMTWFWARLGPDMDRLAKTIEEFSAEVEGRAPKPPEDEDRGREWWLFAGAVTTALAGAAMLIGHRLAVPALALIIVHQLLYFIRQRRRELRAATPEAAAEARPTPQTINGFFSALLMAVLAAWLYAQGALI